MRTLGVLIALTTPGLAFAAEAGPKATLACEIVEEGTRTKLPTTHPIRIDFPVECKISVAGAARPEPYAARIVTTWTDYDGPKKKIPKKSDRLTGTVNGGAPWIAKLESDKDFENCNTFVLEAVLTAPGADTKPVWSKKIQVKQDCPD